MHLQCVHPVEGKHALEASQPARHEVAREVIYHFICLRCKNTAWQVSVQVQAVKTGKAGAVMGSIHTTLLFHINNKLSIRCKADEGY